MAKKRQRKVAASKTAPRKGTAAAARADRTDRAKKKFLEVVAETCNVSEAARLAGVKRRALVYEWRETDPTFAAAWDDAVAQAGDKLEREAWRRAVEGTDKPVTFQGEITDTYKEYSDRMLELLLKAHRPEKYKDRVANEHSGPGGGPIQTQDVPLTPEQLQEELKRRGLPLAPLEE